MKVTNQFLAVIFTVILGFSFSLDANAKRLGGGQSIGKQSSSVTQKQAAPTQASPNSAAQPSAAKPSPTATPATQPKKFGWGGMLGGIAAGLGIGMLLSHFGLGEAAASFFTGMLMFMAVAMIAMWLFRRFAGGNNQPSAYKLNPAGGPAFEETRTNTYTEKSTTPMSSGSTAIVPSEQWVDQESFLANAKKMFVQLQEASDKQNLDTLREFTTPEMFSLIRADFLNRTEAFSTTQVLTLNADLFHVEKEGDTAVASIRFSGLIREEANSPAITFEEVWNWTKPINGQTGWVLAGIQQIS
jgi:predicted lipid-binding transport protein (Tim44 family)